MIICILCVLIKIETILIFVILYSTDYISNFIIYIFKIIS